MTVGLPPDIKTLTKLVRGELAPDDRRTVYRWLGRCTDERIILVIENLILRWEEEKADHLLPASLRDISAWFRRLLDEGVATIDSFASAGASLATLGMQAGDEGLLLTPTQDRAVRIAARCGGDVRWVTVLSSNDLGEFHCLHHGENISGETTDINLQVPYYRIEEREGRLTFWLLTFSVPPADVLDTTSSASMAEWLSAQRDLLGVRVSANRISSAGIFEQP